MSDLVLSSNAVLGHLDEWGLSNADILLPDASYAIPVRAWIEGEFADYARQKLEQIVGSYEEEDADCDDFAEACATIAHCLHRKTLTRPRETALAFGEFWYVSTRGPHAINCFIGLENDAYKLFFFEPQGCRIIDLTKDEIQSCVMLRF